MRFIYLDEAGISASEPIAVVAGVMVDGDRQWRALETRLRELAEEYATEDKRKRIFHAKDIFHGSGDFDRASWPLEKRLELLKKILGIPMSLGVPVIFGHFRKNDELSSGMSAKNKAMIDHVMAFQMCAFAAEQCMRIHTPPEEVAILVAEDNDLVRRAVKDTHHFLNSPDAKEKLPEFLRDTLPFGRIVDTIHFAAKTESPLLQMADACAFAISRYLSERSHAEELFDALSPGKRPQTGGAGGWNLLVPETS